jgi:hypothetical protein
MAGWDPRYGWWAQRTQALGRLWPANRGDDGRAYEPTEPSKLFRPSVRDSEVIWDPRPYAGKTGDIKSAFRRVSWGESTQ